MAGVFPAYAGMIPMEITLTAKEVGVPRICGDDPHPDGSSQTAAQCSPHMRG